MAKHQTSWILELVDKITKPLKDATKATKGSQSAVDDVRDSLDQMSDAQREAAKRSLKSHKNVSEAYDEEQRKIKRLTRELDDLGDSASDASREKIEFEIDEARKEANKYERQLNDIDKELKDIADGPDTAKMKSNWSEAVVVANQTAELVNKAVSGVGFAGDIDNLQASIERMTDVSGDRLDDLTQHAYRLGEQFQENPKEIAKAANAMTKQIGGTYEENLDLIQKGFEKGANINGDFLDQLREYPTFIKQLGLSAEQMVAVTAQANKKGIFSDKALDSIKEANLSLRQMEQPQIDALKGIGLAAEDFADKRGIEKVKMITESMKGATDQAKQLVLADIFKGAGEDSGLAWIEGLNSVDMNINHIKSVKAAGSSISGWLADIKSWFATTFSGLGGTVMAIAPLITAVSTAIPLMATLKEATWAQSIATKGMAAAQWLLNVAMDANPIGIIIIAVVALVGWVALLISHWEDWGAALSLLMGPLGIVVSIVKNIIKYWNQIKNAFTEGGIIAGLKKIGTVILDALLMPVQQLLELVSNIPGIGDLAKLGAAKIAEIRSNLEIDRKDKKEDKKEDQKEGAGASIDNPLGGLNTDQDLSGLNLNTNNTNTTDNSTKNSGTAKAKTGGGIVNMTLEVNNNFDVQDGADFISRRDEILDYIVGKMNDAFRDATIAADV